MKNRKFVKPALIVVAMVLVCVLSVLGTLAYLQSTTEVATNTFTVGNVKITLDEANVDEYGVQKTGENVEARDLENSYKLIPAHTYLKDPTIHVDNASEKAYLGAVITVKGATALEAAGITADKFLGTNGFDLTVGNDWDVVATADKSDDDDTFVYTLIYGEDDGIIVDAGANVVIFGNFTAPNFANELLGTLKDTVITVQGYAIQADGFDNAAKALNTGFSTIFPAPQA